MGHERVVSVSHIPPTSAEFFEGQKIPIHYLSENRVRLAVAGHTHGPGGQSVNGLTVLTAERAKLGRYHIVEFLEGGFEAKVCSDLCEEWGNKRAVEIEN